MWQNATTAIIPRHWPATIEGNNFSRPPMRRFIRYSFGKFVLGTLCVGVVVFLLLPTSLLSFHYQIPKKIDHDFGVGFDLTSPYGTAAVSYPNGTVVNVAKLDGTPTYVETMFRLSLQSSTHLHPPYNSIEDAFRDRPRQLKRGARKSCGLPASSDVGVLAMMIQSLRAAVEAQVGHKISAASITIPRLQALYQEDLEDAFQFVGLIYLDTSPYWGGELLSETAAVYVGNGFGLCSNYTDIPSCDEMEHQSPDEYILSVSYTRSTLTSTLAEAGNGFAYPVADHWRIADLTLGYDTRHDNADEAYYWAKIRDTILKPVLEGNLYLPHHPSKVFLHGECAENAKFKELVTEAIDSISEDELPLFSEHSVFSAARAAAEQAKRIAWRQNSSGIAEPSNSDL